MRVINSFHPITVTAHLKKYNLEINTTTDSMNKAVQGWSICFVGAFQRLKRPFTGIVHFNLAAKIENNFSNYFVRFEDFVLVLHVLQLRGRTMRNNLSRFI